MVKCICALTLGFSLGFEFPRISLESPKPILPPAQRSEAPDQWRSPVNRGRNNLNPAFANPGSAAYSGACAGPNAKGGYLPDANGEDWYKHNHAIHMEWIPPGCGRCDKGALELSPDEAIECLNKHTVFAGCMGIARYRGWQRCGQLIRSAYLNKVGAVVVDDFNPEFTITHLLLEIGRYLQFNSEDRAIELCVKEIDWHVFKGQDPCGNSALKDPAFAYPLEADLVFAHNDTHHTANYTFHQPLPFIPFTFVSTSYYYTNSNCSGVTFWWRYTINAVATRGHPAKPHAKNRSDHYTLPTSSTTP